jgi:hypothetical protein
VKGKLLLGYLKTERDMDKNTEPILVQRIRTAEDRRLEIFRQMNELSNRVRCSKRKECEQLLDRISAADKQSSILSERYGKLSTRISHSTAVEELWEAVRQQEEIIVEQEERIARLEELLGPAN